MTELSTALPRLTYSVTVDTDTPVGQHLSTLAFRYGWPWFDNGVQLTVTVETSPVATHLLLTDLLERAESETLHIRAATPAALHTWPGIVNAGAPHPYDYSRRPPAVGQCALFKGAERCEYVAGHSGTHSFGPGGLVATTP